MHWQEQRIRLKAIDTLAVRHRSAELEREVRREQKLSDEIASRKNREQQIKAGSKDSKD